MRLLLTAIILTMLAQPVWAHKVYYCETKAITQVTIYEVMDIHPVRFKMAVSSEAVKISGEGNFDFKFDEVDMTGWGFFAAEYWRDRPISLAEFYPPRLKVSVNKPGAILAFFAHCEDF